jgi:hypothetical protein
VTHHIEISILQEFQYGKETVQTTTRCLNESNILLTPAFMETGVFKHLGYGNIEW